MNNYIDFSVVALRTHMPDNFHVGEAEAMIFNPGEMVPFIRGFEGREEEGCGGGGDGF